MADGNQGQYWTGSNGAVQNPSYNPYSGWGPPPNSSMPPPMKPSPASTGGCGGSTAGMLIGGLAVLGILAGVAVGAVFLVNHLQNKDQQSTIITSPGTITTVTYTVLTSSTPAILTTLQPVISWTAFSGSLIVSPENQKLRQKLLSPNTAEYINYKDDICITIRDILIDAGIDSSVNCTVAVFSRQNYQLNYTVTDIGVRQGQTTDGVLTEATTAIVRGIADSDKYDGLSVSKTSVKFIKSPEQFHVNCNSIVCPTGSNCVSVIGGKICVCNIGYTKNITTSQCTECSPSSAIKCLTSSNTNICAVKCNGVIECSNAADETGCPCTDSQYQCPKEKLCKEGSTWCDGKSDCSDKTDEPPNCSKACPTWTPYPEKSSFGGQWQNDLTTLAQCQAYCFNEPQCLAVDFEVVNKQCNIHKNATNLAIIGKDPGFTQYRLSRGICSIACPAESIGLCNATGKCLFPIHKCNYVQDCPDDFDESKCDCLSYQYKCGGLTGVGRCIYGSWKCDGNKDCPNGEDELQCKSCHATTEYRCARDDKCISITSQCDGISDCSDSADENQCFHLEGSVNPKILKATFKGVNNLFVSDVGWSQSNSGTVCKLLGYSGKNPPTRYGTVSNANASCLKVSTSSSSKNILFDATQGPCNLDKTNTGNILVTCNPQTCGKKILTTNTSVGYVINGERAEVGAWPWQAQIFLRGSKANTLTCGGALINEKWVLTAARCLKDNYKTVGYNGTTKFQDIKLQFGSITRSEGPVMLSVSQVIVHPNFTTSGNRIFNDIGLLRLTESVESSDTIQPICLPSKDIDDKLFKVCFITGFGQTTAVEGSYSDYLLQARMNIMPTSECERVRPFVDFTTMCVGSLPTALDRNIGQGDSGGPLSCLDASGIWTVMGVNSYGGAENDYSILTRVPYFADWIETNINA